MSDVLVIAADAAEGQRLCTRIEQLGLSATWWSAADTTGDFEALLTGARLVLIAASAPATLVRSWIERIRAQEKTAFLPILLQGFSDRERAHLYAEADDVLPPEEDAEWACRVRVWSAVAARLERLLEERIAERTDLLERALSGQELLLEEVRAARARWEAMFHAIADGLALTTPEGIIEQANEALVRLFGFSLEYWRGRSCRLLWERFGHTGTCPHERAALEEGLVQQEGRDATTGRTLQLIVTPVRSVRGEVLGWVHLFRDVTLQRQLERQALQAERMVLAGQIVSGIAHEAATPLSVIANIAESLLLDLPPESSMASDLRSILAQARRITEMLRQLLDVVRQAPPAFRAFDVNALVEETLALLRHNFRKARVEVRTELEPDLPPFWGDRNQMQQVLLNLFTNALHAMPEGGRLLVRTGISGGSSKQIELVVEDTGVGIPPEYLPRIFDFFFTTRADRGGTGLGLAITRQIVEAHEGTIHVESAPGQGTRFRLRFPLRPEWACRSAADPGQEAPSERDAP